MEMVSTSSKTAKKRENVWNLKDFVIKIHRVDVDIMDMETTNNHENNTRSSCIITTTAVKHDHSSPSSNDLGRTQIIPTTTPLIRTGKYNERLWPLKELIIKLHRVEVDANPNRFADVYTPLGHMSNLISRPEPLVPALIPDSSNASKSTNTTSDSDSNANEHQEQIYTCTHCSKSFPRRYSLVRHEKIHTTTRVIQYKCSQCEEIFTDREELRNHVQQLHKKLFSCEFCKKTFGQKVHLEIHIRRHTKEKNFTCSTCSKTFSTSGDLGRHKGIHALEKPYKCEFCTKAFVQRAHLIQHTRTHTGEKPFDCQFCSKSFAQTSDRRKHERTHTGEKNHVCSFCNKMFSGRAGLRTHILIVHTKEKNYKCSFPGCELAFPRNSDLAKHEKVHDDVKPFSCSDCDSSFRRAAHLKVHREAVHQLGIPVHCSVCKKVIYGRTQLKAHKKQHVKKFSCEECSSKFATNVNLKRHVSCVHRKERPFTCSVCKNAFSFFFFF